MWVWQIIIFHRHPWSSLPLILFIADQKSCVRATRIYYFKRLALRNWFPWWEKEKSPSDPEGHFIILSLDIKKAFFFFSFKRRWEYFWKGINFSAPVKTVTCRLSHCERNGPIQDTSPVIRTSFSYILGSGSFRWRLGFLYHGMKLIFYWWFLRLKLESLSLSFPFVKGFHCFQIYNDDGLWEQALLLVCRFKLIGY